MRKLSEFKICGHMLKKNWSSAYEFCNTEANYALDVSLLRDEETMEEKIWIFICKSHLIELVTNYQSFEFKNRDKHFYITIHNSDIERVEYCTIEQYFAFQKKIEMLL